MTAHDLYRVHRPYVRACLRRLGVSEAGLEDAVQDVFVVLVRRLEDLAPDRGVRGWLWGVSRKVAWAHRRRERRICAAVEPACTPTQETRAALARALKALEPDHLDVLVLAEVEGRTAREISVRLDLPLTTVQWRLRAARRRLRGLHRPGQGPGARLRSWLPLLGRHSAGSSLWAPAAVALTLLGSPRGPTPVELARTPAPAVHGPIHVIPWSTRRSQTPPPKENPVMLQAFTIAAVLAVAPSPPVDAEPSTPPATDQDADAAAFQGKSGDTAIYIFTGDDVEGAVWKPTGENLRGPGTVRHESLLTLRNHFNSELVKLSLEL